MEQDSLELELGTQFKGIEEAKAYASALRGVARAETAAAKAVKEANDALKAMPPASSLPAPPTLRGGKAPLMGTRAFGPASPSMGLPMGPNQRLLQAGDTFDRAKMFGSTAQIADAHYSLRLAQNRHEQAQRGSMSPMAQALYSTRVNLPGGAAPLLGKTLEGVLGKQKAIGLIEGVSTKLMPMLGKLLPVVGTFVAIAHAGVEVAKQMYAMADASAKATNALTDQQAQTGGSVEDVSRLGLMGADPSKARGFNERITSDPLAMAAAGSVGVANLKAPYGDLNFGKKYLTAIERVSKIADESLRRKLALTLGIEEEVARYALLSEYSRRQIADTASQTGFVNDPKAQKAAAEFKSAQERMNQSFGNFSNATSQLFMNDITGLMDETAKLFGGLSTFTKKYGPMIRSLIIGKLMGPVAAIMDTLTGQGAPPGSGNNTALDANTQSNMELNQSIQYLTKNIGESNRSREATDRFRTFGSATGYAQGMRSQFAFGALG